MNSSDLERFARHIILKEIGGAGQQKLLGARCAIIGAGGLGGPAALYLAAAGTGHITVIDDDVVSLSNLQRQIQFGFDDIDSLKTEALGQNLRRIHDTLDYGDIRGRLDHNSAQDWLSGFDVILDGSDNFETRFAVNHGALFHKTPLVSGAVGRWDGQVASFKGDGAGPCYRCFVPEAPPDAQTCAEVGIVGALTGIIGSVMALDAIKIITGAGDPLYGRVWVFDGLDMESRTLTLNKDPNCQSCG